MHHSMLNASADGNNRAVAMHRNRRDRAGHHRGRTRTRSRSLRVRPSV